MATESRRGSSGAALVVETSSKAVQHRQAITKVLTEYAERSASNTVQTVPIFDREHDRYQLLDIGWDEANRRIFQPILHIDLIDQKAWIQENITDWDVGKSLIQAGFEPSEIVLGMHSKVLRQLGEYAIE